MKTFEEYWMRYGEMQASMCGGDIKQFAKEIWRSAIGDYEKNIEKIIEIIEIIDGEKWGKEIYSSPNKYDARDCWESHNQALDRIKEAIERLKDGQIVSVSVNTQGGHGDGPCSSPAGDCDDNCDACAFNPANIAGDGD